MVINMRVLHISRTQHLVFGGFCIMFSISFHKTYHCSFFILRFANIA